MKHAPSELVDPGCRMFELVFGRDHSKHRRCDQVVSLEDPVDAALWYEVFPLVRHEPGDLPAGLLRILPGYLDDPLLLSLRDLVPHLP